MPKHDHKPVETPKPCKHDLKFCEQCNAVECMKCSTEWVLPCTKSHAHLHDYNSIKGNPFDTTVRCENYTIRGVA